MLTSEIFQMDIVSMTVTDGECVSTDHGHEKYKLSTERTHQLYILLVHKLKKATNMFILSA